MLGLGLGLGRNLLLGGGGAPADPLQALIQQRFSSGQDGVLYAAMPVVNGVQVLWQDVAGTVPVTTSGDPVARIDDVSGRGNNALQSTSAKRPTYQTDGTLHWLEGDGVDDEMVFGMPSMAGSDKVSLTVAMRQLNDDDLEFAFGCSGTSATGYFGLWSSLGSGGWTARGQWASGTQDFALGGSVGEDHVVTAEFAFDGASPAGVAYFDGANAGTFGTPADVGAYSSNTFYIFSRSNLNANARFYGAIVTNDIQDPTLGEEYLASLSGVILP